MVLCLYQDLRVCVCVLILIWEICITLPLLLAKQALWSRDNNIIMKMKCVGIEANSNSRSGKYYYNTSQNASNKTQSYFITARQMIITSVHNFKNSISTSLCAAHTHFLCKVQLNVNHLIHNLIKLIKWYTNKLNLLKCASFSLCQESWSKMFFVRYNVLLCVDLHRKKRSLIGVKELAKPCMKLPSVVHCWVCVPLQLHPSSLPIDFRGCSLSYEACGVAGWSEEDVCVCEENNAWLSASVSDMGRDNRHIYWTIYFSSEGFLVFYFTVRK